MKRPPPDPDGIITARLHGASSRHAGWKQPTGEHRVAAITELCDIAGGRADLLAQVAGVGLGCHPPGDPQHEHHRIAADLLLEAGADPVEMERWIAIGAERREHASAPPLSLL